MNLFYTPDINTGTYTLNKEESAHCVLVFRLKIGSEIHLTDGIGNLYKAVLVDNNPKACVVEIRETINEFEKRNFNLHIAMAPTKNIARVEWFIEKATEIGIDEFTFLLCDHSERLNIKTERLHKIVTSAVKQSIKAYHPVIHGALKFKDLIKKYQTFTGKKYLAYCNDDMIKRVSLKDNYKKGEDALILIGPEGDFSKHEVDLAIENGFKLITLGKSRLRTETAAVAACHTINLINE